LGIAGDFYPGDHRSVHASPAPVAEGNYVKGAARDNGLWLQTSVGNFTDVGTQWHVGDDCGRGRFVVFLDADGDGDLDVYCLARADGSNPNDFVMLNNGNGMSWTSLTVPPVAATTDGDEANPVHPFGTSSPAQFIVLNGGNSSAPGGSGGGPVQLIQVIP
jgi:hypothetical protein